MRLVLLGAGELLSDEGEVLLRPGLPLVLLAYLHLSGGRVARERLVALFWPEAADSARALQALRQTLRRIRSACGPDLLLAQDREVVLAEGVLSSDVETLNRFLALGALESALETCRGEFLQDLRFPQNWALEDWIEARRSELCGALKQAVAREIRGLLAGGEVAAARDLVERALARFPGVELLLRLKLEALLELGALAESAGVLAEIRRLDPVDPVDELDARLRAASQSSGVEGRRTRSHPLQPEEGVPAPADRGGRSFRLFGARAALSAGALMAGAVFLLGGLVLGWWGWSGLGARGAGVAAGSSGWRLLACTTADTEGDRYELVWISPDGRESGKIFPGPACMVHWLDEGRELVALVDPDPYPSLVRLTAEGRGGRSWRAARLEALSDLLEPRISDHGTSVLDGRYLLVTARAPGEATRSVWLLDGLADRSRRLTDERGDDDFASFDPVRREVLFSSDREGTPSLFALPVDDPGAEPVRLTVSPSQDTRADARGGRILFVRGFGESGFEGDMEIVMLDRSNGREEVLVSNRWNDYNPSWSPTGSAFCWQSEEFGHYESRVVVMEVATRRTRVLTEGVPGRNSDCRWTPDGRGVVVRSNRGDGIPRPWLYPSQGGAATPLSRHSWPVEPKGFLPRTPADEGSEEEGVRAGPGMRPGLQPR